jgi:ATP-binding cassette, subfamily F, member 3
MAILTTTNLGKSFVPVDIFLGINVSVPNRARIAIVGPNGIGKTSLIRILAGEDVPSQGTVNLSKGKRVGYLPQEAKFKNTHSLWEECLVGIKPLLEMEKNLKIIESQLTKDAQNKELLNTYGALQTRFDVMGGYTYESRIKQVLAGLGFNKDEYGSLLPQLSGGQRTRALLARLLLEAPDLLILDEPTNHLDIEAVEWLESYLMGWDGAVLIVSHDRYFIDRSCNNIWEMGRNGFETYRGNYSNYLMQRDIRWDDRATYAQTEINRMHKELRFIKKHIAGQLTQQAKGKLSRISREIIGIENLGFEGVRGKKWSQIAHQSDHVDRKPMRVADAFARVSALTVPTNRTKNVKIAMRTKQRSGNIILRANDLKIGYVGNELFELEKLEMHRLECAALIGPNGTGKTTFLKTILEEIPSLGGNIDLGASLSIGYFAQAHEDLDPNLTIIEEIAKMEKGMLEGEIRSYLGKYLFTGEDQYKKVDMLSGGERGRLALAKLALLNANLLILDEPSNHLDIPAQEILQQVLSDYDGTIIMVSHDRYLIDALATQIWAIDSDGKRLEIFKGTYSKYKGYQNEIEIEEIDTDVEEIITSTKEQPPQKISKNEQKKLQARIYSVEDTILKLETKLNQIGRKLQKTDNTPEQIRDLGEDFAYTDAELADAMEDWEKLQI